MTSRDVFLPLELLRSIFAHLDYAHIVRCRQLNKAIQEFIDNDVLLQYIIELAIAGMDDGPPSALSTLKRRAILQEHQQAWTNLEWRRRDVHEFSFANGNFFWGLTGGVLTEFAWVPTNPVWRQLPSVIRGIEYDRRTVDRLIGTRAFAVDPVQDLLVLVVEIIPESPNQLTWVYHFHMRSLTTGDVHPLSSGTATIEFRLPEDFDLYPDLEVLLCGDTLALVFKYERNSVMTAVSVLNWRTGEEYIQTQGEGLDAVCLLSPQYLLVFNIHDDFPSRSDAPRIHVFDIYALSKQGTFHPWEAMGNICEFEYPALDSSRAIDKVVMQCDPSPGFTPSPSPYPEASSRSFPREVPFSTTRAPGAQLIAVTWWLSLSSLPTLASASVLVSLIPTSTLLSAIASLPPRPKDPCYRSPVIPWSSWGPHGSRFLCEPLVSTCKRSRAFGMSYAMLEWTEDPDMAEVVVLDFNPLKVRRALSVSRAQEADALDQEGVLGDEEEVESDGGVEENEEAVNGDEDEVMVEERGWDEEDEPGEVLVTAPTRFEGEWDVFRHTEGEIQTSLPCLQRRSRPIDMCVVDGIGHYDSVALSEDSILLMTNIPSSQAPTFLVLTF